MSEEFKHGRCQLRSFRYTAHRAEGFGAILEEKEEGVREGRRGDREGEEGKRSTGRGGEPRMEGDALTSHAGDTVGDRVTGEVKSSGDGAQGACRTQEGEDEGVADRAFDVVVHEEGLGGEVGMAEAAEEAGNGAEGKGMMEAFAGEPGVLGGRAGEAVEGTEGVRAKGRRSGRRGSHTERKRGKTDY